MKNNRRKFLKYAGLAGLGIAGGKFTEAFASIPGSVPVLSNLTISPNIETMKPKEENIS